MTTAAIITVAITGSVPRKKDTPAIPITPVEQVESTHEAFEAGATVAHIHVRHSDESPASDPELFARVQEGIHKHCPGMVVQFSTGGRGRNPEERGGMLYLRPEMASLTTGSVNFTNWVFENSPAFVEEMAATMQKYGIKPEIEVFDVSMLYVGSRLADNGLVSRPLHVQFVMGITNALPFRRSLVEFLVSELHDTEPDATWTAAAIGRHQLEANRLSLELGGHCRTGLEDNIKYDRDRLAHSNAELVERVASLCPDYGRHPASMAETRELLRLPPHPG